VWILILFSPKLDLWQEMTASGGGSSRGSFAVPDLIFLVKSRHRSQDQMLTFVT
jgi:hypothetical protein